MAAVGGTCALMGGPGMPGSEDKNVRTVRPSEVPRHQEGLRKSAKHPSPPVADLDTQLMLQIRDGNREAANTLYRRNQLRIARYIARIVGRGHCAEDLTQDVFLQAITHAHQYQPTAKVTTWLYRIATNRALNHLKGCNVSRHAGQSDVVPLEVADNRNATPDQHMNLDELRCQVASAISGLPINQRIALTLFEYEQCSYEQIATVLDVTVEAVRSLLMRARATLRCQLRKLV